MTVFVYLSPASGGTGNLPQAGAGDHRKRDTKDAGAAQLQPHEARVRHVPDGAPARDESRHSAGAGGLHTLPAGDWA